MALMGVFGKASYGTPPPWSDFAGYPDTHQGPVGQGSVSGGVAPCQANSLLQCHDHETVS